MNASGMWFIDCTKRIDLIVHVCSFPASILKLVHLPFQILQQFVQVLKELLLKIKENILINQKHLLFVVPNTFSGLLFFILVRHHNLLRHLLRLPLGLSSTTAPPWTSTMVVYQVRRPKFHYWYWGEVPCLRPPISSTTTPTVILTTTLLFANFFDMSCPFFPLSNCFSICLTKGISAVNVSEISF